MPYIGQQVTTAQPSYLIIDDISSSFDGSTTSFALQVNGSTPTPFPVAAQNCLISVGGVVQEPDSGGTNGFLLSGTNIVFSSAPSSGESFWGVVLAGADYVNVGASFPDGSVANPSITFDQDTDTGLFRPGVNSVALGTGGSEALRVDSSQRLLVGTTSYSGNATLVLENNSGNTSFGHLRINRNTSSPADGNSLGLITFSDNTTSYSADIIAARDGGTWSASSKPTRLVFSTTADGASSPTERLRINASGAMGFGVTPEPQGSGFVNFQFGGLGNLGASSSQAAGGAIYLYNNTYRATAGQWHYLVTDEATRYQALNGRHQFDVAPSGTADTTVSFAEKIRIDTDGLKFNGDTSADNALDDYEEGTWTPAAANYGGTLTVNSASYVKIGQLCFVHAYISFSSFSDSDEVLITGLPFTANSSGSVYYPIPTQTSTNIEDIFLRAQGALTTLRAVYQNGSSGDAKLTYSQVSGAFLIFGGCYRTT